MDTNEGETEPVRLTPGDFVLGTLHYTAKQRAGKFVFNANDMRFHSAMKSTYDRLKDRALLAGVEVGFAIAPDPIHGDSRTVHEEVSFLFSLGILRSLGGSFVQVIYSIPDSNLEYIPGFLPGSPALYEELATSFITAYEKPPTNIS